MNDHISRILRTFIQLAAGGGITVLLTQVAKDVPTAYAPYILILSTLLVTVAQNVAEEQGWIPMVLRSSNDD